MADRDEAFAKRLQDLVAFKSKFGHCDVPFKKYPDDPSLGSWCNSIIIEHHKFLPERKENRI